MRAVRNAGESTSPRSKASLILACILAVSLAGVFLVCKKMPVGSPPDTPSTPSGVTNGGFHTSYEYTSMAVDPDSDSVAIRFDWGDGAVSEWSVWVASGEAVTQSHAWTDPGLYNVKAQAKDQTGSTSDWSEALAVTISTNLPPNTPATPSGPSSGCKDSTYSFTTITTDPDEDGVCYRFTWGTGDTSEWSAWFQSGQPGGASNVWCRAGAYVLKAQAKDSKDAASSWSTHTSSPFRTRTRLQHQPLRRARRMASRTQSMSTTVLHTTPTAIALHCDMTGETETPQNGAT